MVSTGSQNHVHLYAPYRQNELKPNLWYETWDKTSRQHFIHLPCKHSASCCITALFSSAKASSQMPLAPSILSSSEESSDLISWTKRGSTPRRTSLALLDSQEAYLLTAGGTYRKSRINILTKASIQISCKVSTLIIWRLNQLGSICRKLENTKRKDRYSQCYSPRGSGHKGATVFISLPRHNYIEAESSGGLPGYMFVDSY